MILTLSFAPQQSYHTHFPCTNVLILNPRVGLMPIISSPLSFFRIVVFPALSRPLDSSRYFFEQ